MKLVIKGALYFNGAEILKPHYTGEFFIVHCTNYMTEEALKENFDEVPNDVDDYIEHNGQRYYSNGDYSPYATNEMDLISEIDLSQLFFNGESLQVKQ